MASVLLLFVPWVGGALLLAVLATVRAPATGIPAWAARPAMRVRAAGEAVVPQLGRLGAGLVVVLTGWALTIITEWGLGKVAHKVEVQVDHPVFRWVADHQVQSWSRWWLEITNMGSPRITQMLTVVGAVGLAGLFRMRGMRWQVPLFGLPLAYLLVKHGQIILIKVVDRGHPPTTHGTWPSGGCARVVVIYGLIVLGLLLWSRTTSVRAWVGGASFVMVCMTVQAYARLYNQEHWLTDVLGGMVYGWMMLATMTAAFLVWTGRSAPTSRVGGGRAPASAETLDARKSDELGLRA